jgi:hypothetical protein
MLESERSARTPTHVGFLFVELSDRLALKARMVAGEFGKPLEFSFLGLTARNPAYFQRSNWAGRLRLGDGLVLDSCLGNAMAHYLNNMRQYHQGHVLCTVLELQIRQICDF